MSEPKLIGVPAGRRLPRLANRWPIEQRMFFAALLVILPSNLTVLGLLWLGDYSDRIRVTLSAITLLTSIAALLYLRERAAYSLRTIANLLSAIREGDFSFRLRPNRIGDPLDELIDEANALRDMLHWQRIEVAESGALLDTLLAGIDVAVFAFDSQQRLRRANRRAESLMGARFDEMEGQTAHALGLAECLTGPNLRAVTLAKDAAGRRWELKRTTVRHVGEPLQLILLWDVTAALHGEQQEAWSRLIRVMRHEISNSLAPITSLAATMLQLVERVSYPDEWRADFKESLEIIVKRAEALERMLQSYTQLSGEPPPMKSAVDLAAMVRRVAATETRSTVNIVGGENVTVMADEDQLDRVLVNIVRNAVDANQATGGTTAIGWSVLKGAGDGTPAGTPSTAPIVEVWIEDEGPGLLNTDNLFVPFFSTKPGGSGVGLALARLIAEAHGGSLTLVNRLGARGCRAALRIPLR